MIPAPIHHLEPDERARLVAHRGRCVHRSQGRWNPAPVRLEHDEIEQVLERYGYLRRVHYKRRGDVWVITTEGRAACRSLFDARSRPRNITAQGGRG